MKQFKSALLLYSLCIIPSVVSAQIVDEFVCGGTNGTRPMKMWIENGHLKAYTTKQLDYGPVQITPTHYKARMSQPLMTDGTGWAETTFTIERLTGRFEFEVNANRPGAPKPFHSLGEGVCTGVDGFDSLSRSQSKADESTSMTATEHAKENHLSQKTNDAQENQNDGQREKDRQDLEAQHTQRERERERAETAKLDQRKQEEARIAREKAENERKKKEEDARIAKDKANRDAKERAEQEHRNNENGIRSSFSGWATTCAGGGKDVLYLQTSRPPTTGCTVNFQARCPNNAASVDFTQRNYIGGSCMGLGDNIRIGTLPCDAKQVQITVTSASCGL